MFASDLASLSKLGDQRDYLEDDFKQYLNLAYLRITCSGTVALYLIMETIKELSSNRTIIIPSFICPLVPLAVHRAGFRIRVCDISHSDFNYDYAELESLCSTKNDTAGIIACHLAGIPVDMDALLSLSKRHRLFIIEDCAQSLGAYYNNKKVGTFGDFSFFSLCRGKGITTYEGGAVATNNQEYGIILDTKLKQLLTSNLLLESLRILQLWGYWLFYRPQLFWFVFNLPQIFWNLQGNVIKALAEDFNLYFPIHGISNIRKLLAHAAFCRLEEAIKKQRAKASYYISQLSKKEGIRVIEEPAGAQATYPYLTIVFDDRDKQKKALRNGQSAGLGISQIYALPITDYYYLKDIISGGTCSTAQLMAQRSITLSTSTFLQESDLHSVVNMMLNL